MRSMIQAVNTTGETKTIGSVELAQGVPTVIFRNSTIFGDSAELGKLLGLVVDGSILIFDFDGSELTSQEVQISANYLGGQFHQDKDRPSFSEGYHWRIDTCSALLDGLLKQIAAFNFEGAGVTVDRAGVISRAMDVLALLGVGYLEDAADKIETITPDTDSDFLSASTLATFVALFGSAQE